MEKPCVDTKVIDIAYKLPLVLNSDGTPLRHEVPFHRENVDEICA